MDAQRRSKIAFASGTGILVAFFLTVHAVRLVEPFGMDQGCFACFARWIPDGWLPYRDLFDSKAPLFVYTWALAGLLPGDVERAAWWFEGAWLAGTMLVAYALTTRIWGRAAGLATAALVLAGTWSPSWGGFWSRAQSEELLALPLLGAAWVAWRAVDRVTLAFWAGVLTGCCGLYKIPSMAIGVAWAATWMSTMSTREVARRVSLAVVGALLPWALTFLWFWGNGALSSFLDAVFVYQGHHAQYIAPEWGDVIVDFAGTMLTRATLPLGAAALGVLLLARRRARELHWIAPWIVAASLAVVLQRQLAGYHYLLMMPGLAVAGGYGLAELVRMVRDPAGRRLAAVALLAVLLVAVREAAAWWNAYSPDLTYLRGAVPRETYLRRFQMGSFSAATEEQAARYIRDHSGASDGVLVWGLSPGIYSLSGRHPATRYVFHKLLVTDAPVSLLWPGLPERKARFMERVRADSPLYVLVGRGDANGFEPSDSFESMMRFSELRDFLTQGYRVETQIGRFTVYRRLEGPAP